MNNTQTMNRNIEAIAWGTLFIWWGTTEIFKSLPDGIGPAGIGLILIGVNIVRSLNGLPVSRFSTTVGILAIVWGGLELLEIFLSLPFELPSFAILLIVLGVIILAPELLGRRSQ